MTRSLLKNTRPLMLFALGGLITTTLGGCVSQSRFDAAERDNRMLRDQLAQFEQEHGSYAGQLENERRLRQQAEAAAQQANAALAGAQGDLSEMERRLLALGDQVSEVSLMGLDRRTDQALRELARKYAGRIVYDPDRGMLRFSSDLTFASGQDAVTADGRQSLTDLAEILKAPEARGYELDIVGHTDSQPISSRTRERHPTNMHLAAHRAISVRRELVTMGLPANQIQASGWGEHRPMVPNTSNGNTPQNRRVEIFIRPSTAPGTTGFTSVPSTGIEADIDDARGSRGPIIDK
ncbi:MAG: OmpA family protein [Phycisphaera sp.]|nr:MAG: OmpA family protein [Phycisphaera sp.]